MLGRVLHDDLVCTLFDSMYCRCVHTDVLLSLFSCRAVPKSDITNKVFFFYQKVHTKLRHTCAPMGICMLFVLGFYAILLKTPVDLYIFLPFFSVGFKSPFLQAAQSPCCQTWHNNATLFECVHSVKYEPG